MKHLNSCNQMTSLKLVDRKEKFFYFRKAIKINTQAQLKQFIEQPPKPGLRHPYETFRPIDIIIYFLILAKN